MFKKQSRSISKIYSFFFGAFLGIISVTVFQNFETKKIPGESGVIEILFTGPKAFREIGFIEIEKKLIQLINQSKESVYIQSYSFTSMNLVQALIRAFKRGIDVQLLLDKENEIKPSPALLELINSKIPVKIRRLSGIAHDKIMIVDKKIVQTGSFNYTKNANERNAENIVILYNNPQVVQAYLKNWHKSNKNSAYPWSGESGKRGWMDKPDFVPKNMKEVANKSCKGDKREEDKNNSKVWTVHEKILQATKSVYVDCQIGLSQEIADALLVVANRGIKVKLLAGNVSRDSQKIINYLINKGIETHKTTKVHNKPKTRILIDNATLVVMSSEDWSSFNYRNDRANSFLTEWNKNCTQKKKSGGRR